MEGEQSQNKDKACPVQGLMYRVIRWCSDPFDTGPGGQSSGKEQAFPSGTRADAAPITHSPLHLSNRWTGKEGRRPVKAEGAFGSQRHSPFIRSTSCRESIFSSPARHSPLPGRGEGSEQKTHKAQGRKEVFSDPSKSFQLCRPKGQEHVLGIY